MLFVVELIKYYYLILSCKRKRHVCVDRSNLDDQTKLDCTNLQWCCWKTAGSPNEGAKLLSVGIFEVATKGTMLRVVENTRLGVVEGTRLGEVERDGTVVRQLSIIVPAVPQIVAISTVPSIPSKHIAA